MLLFKEEQAMCVDNYLTRDEPERKRKEYDDLQELRDEEERYENDTKR